MRTLTVLVFVPWAIKLGKKFQNCTMPFLPENSLNPTPAHIRMGKRSRRRPLNTIEVEYEVGYKKSIAYVSAIFLHAVFEKSAIISVV